MLRHAHETLRRPKSLAAVKGECSGQADLAPLEVVSGGPSLRGLQFGAQLREPYRQMKPIISAICVATLSHGTMAAAMAPAQAAPYSQSQTWKFQRHEHYAYLNGYRGDRHRHKGWRYYDGFYFRRPPLSSGG